MTCQSNRADNGFRAEWAKKVVGHSRPHPPENLLRALGLFDSTCIVVGTIIGSGVFLVPSSIAGQLDSLWAVMLAWVVGGVLSLFGALSLAELGAAFPSAGGLYVYLAHAYGRLTGFLYGWGLITMIHSGSLATLAAAFSLYCGRLLDLGPAAQKSVGISCILFLTLVNCLGIRAGKWVQNLSTVAKLAGLLSMIGLLLWRGTAGKLWSESLVGGGGLPDAASFGLALIAVFWAYEGWHVVSFTAGEIREPARNLPLSLVIGTLIIAAVYLAANVAYYAVLDAGEIRSSAAVAATALAKAYGPSATLFISLLILVSIFGAMNGMTLTGPRVYYAMARDGLFFGFFQRLSRRYQTPVFSILLQGVWASLLTMLGTFQELFTYVIFTSWIFYGMTVAGVIVLRRRRPELHRPFVLPAYPWLPALFSLCAAGLTLNTILSDPGHALLGIAFILVGAPIGYLFLRTRKNPLGAGNP